MTISLYDQLAATDEGARALAAARLRYEALAQIHEALSEASLTQAELARKLDIRRSAVNQVVNGDGNMRVSTLAEYLHALGYELKLGRVEAGSIRRHVVAARPVHDCEDGLTPSDADVTTGVPIQVWDEGSDESLFWDDSDEDEHAGEFVLLGGMR